MDVRFNIEKQTLRQTDVFEKPIQGSNNYLKCQFHFLTPEWKDINKIVIFVNEYGQEVRRYIGNLCTGECIVPMTILKGDYFRVSVYGGDLITTNEVIVVTRRAGYKPYPYPDHKSGHKHHPHHGHKHCNDQDIFVDIFDELDNRVTITEFLVNNENINNLLNLKADSASFDSSFDARMELWVQDLIDGINEL